MALLLCENGTIPCPLRTAGPKNHAPEHNPKANHLNLLLLLTLLLSAKGAIASHTNERLPESTTELSPKSTHTAQGEASTLSLQNPSNGPHSPGPWQLLKPRLLVNTHKTSPSCQEGDLGCRTV